MKQELNNAKREEISKEENLNNQEIQELDFSAYDFMSLFCAIYASQKCYSFNKESLLNFIIISKYNQKYKHILQNIRFYLNGLFYDSLELHDAVAKLKWANILYELPNDNINIHIYENVSVTELFENRSNYYPEMIDFISKYKALDDIKTEENTDAPHL